MSTTVKIIGIVLFYLFTIGTGIIIHKAGRPFNPILSALHKLIALAVVVGTILIIRSAFISFDPSGVAIVFLVISLVLLVSLFITGALLSGENEMPFVLMLHDIATYSSPVAMAVTFFLLFKP